MDEDEQLRLLRAIERNTEATERNLAATRSIAIYLLGWIIPLIIGVFVILVAALVNIIGIGSSNDFASGVAVFIGLVGMAVILGGVIMAIANSLKELAKSSK
jgi:predicted phage tail protein